MTHDSQPSPSSSRLPLILVTVFLNIMGLGLILPVLPFYATDYGADGAQVGLLFTAFSGCQFLASPVFGALSDRFGRRPIILFGVLGQMLSYLLMGFATSLTMLFVSRIFSGATAGNISATQAYVADITRPEERTRAYGLVGAAFGAGLLFGPALGGVLTLIDSRAPAFGAAALLGLNLVFGFVLLSESLPRERRAPKPIRNQLNPVGVLVPLVRRPPLRGPLLATLLLNVALTGFQANFAVFAGRRFGFGPTEVSALFVATGLANVLVQLVLVPRLSLRFADAALVVTGGAANAIGNLATAFTPMPTTLWASLPVMTGGYSLSRGPLTSLITKLVAPYEQGMANGGVQATISLAGVIGPLWAGFAFEYLGEPAPYWSSALAVVVACAVIVVLRPRPAVVEAVAARPTPATLELEPRHTVEVAADGVGALLQGSLAGLGLLPVARFLASAGKRGCLYLSRDGWAGRLHLNGDRVVSASFGREHGLAALDAILLVLSEARFSFVESSAGADDPAELSMVLDELTLRPPSVPVGQRGFAVAIPSPTTVPRVAQLREPGRDSSELRLRFGTLQTLLAIDGQRTIHELSDNAACAQVLVDLAILTDLGLIDFDSATTRPLQFVG